MHVIARLLWNKRVDRREKDLPKKYLPPLSPAQRLQLATYPSYIQTNVSNPLESSSLTCRQMSFEEMSPKIFRPPLYYNVDDLLESVFHDYTTVISLLYTNYLFFFGHITDAAQLIHTVRSFIVCLFEKNNTLLSFLMQMLILRHVLQRIFLYVVKKLLIRIYIQYHLLPHF
jgi:hypothetical protein